jgi:galactofuranosylgalactofuranosylrhamnosyl-N-acetylglucosaminyl-diphospho-decaprenol beta-1,5/1,6-galactofuranosyltransferase
MGSTVLQDLLLPTLEACRRIDLYVRLGPGAELSTLDACLRLGPDGEVGFDTYFGSFPVTRWRDRTTVRSLALELDVTGGVGAEVVLAHPHRAERVVARAELDGDGGPCHLAVPGLDDVRDGLLAVRLTGRSRRCEVRGGRWTTDDEPERDVRLGVIITTFNRPEFVQANIDRLFGRPDGRVPAPEAASGMRVLVVDNGRNLAIDVPEGAPVRVVPNPNIGGAGGFARGLHELRRERWATHALVMDDDVRFEPESLRRTRALLAYASDPRMSVHGSMLSADRPAELFEAGAHYRRRTVSPLDPVGRGRDMADWQSLLSCELDGSFDYAAWWFLAVPLPATDDYPVPMFVRGDDVCWGLLHDGRRTVTMPGVAVWHQDFDAKLSPTGWYYEIRNFTLTDVLADEGYRWWHAERRFLDAAVRPLFAFKYDTADHVTRGMRDLLAGPERWMALDQARLNADLRTNGGERIGALDEDLARLPLQAPAPALRRLAGGALAGLTLGGNLLPRRLRAGTPRAAVPLQTRGVIASLARDEVVYRHELRPEGFVARRDRRRFFALLAEILRIAAAIPLRFDRVAGAYRDAYPRMAGDEYWSTQFSRPGAAGDAPGRVTRAERVREGVPR